jgi:hypothetical protein
VRRALDTADLSSVEERDRVLAEVGGVVRGLPPSVLRSELVQLVAGRLGLSDALAGDALGNGAAAARGERGASPVARRALDRREESEHSFLALCLALPEAGRAHLSGEGVDTLFSSALVRRAAAHLRDHLDAPSSGLPGEDEPLRALVAELVVRAGALENAEPPELDRAALMLDLARLDAVRPDLEDQHGMSLRALLAGLDLAEVAALGDEHRDVDTWTDLRDIAGA